MKKNKKRRREKHRNRYSPELMSSHTTSRHHNRKRKHKSLDMHAEPEPPRQGIKLFVSIVVESSFALIECCFTWLWRRSGTMVVIRRSGKQEQTSVEKLGTLAQWWRSGWGKAVGTDTSVEK